MRLWCLVIHINMQKPFLGSNPHFFEFNKSRDFEKFRFPALFFSFSGLTHNELKTLQ